LSTTHSYLALFRSHGQRLFVELADGWHLLDEPAAYEMAPEACRWFYKYSGGLIRIESRACTDRHELTLSIEVMSGPARRFLLSNHVAINGDDGAEPVPVRYAQEGQSVFIRPIPDSDLGWRFPEGGFRINPLPGTVIERLGTDELLFADGRSRNQPFLCLITAPAVSVGFRLTGCLVPAHAGMGMTAERYWSEMTTGLRLRPPVGSPLAGDA